MTARLPSPMVSIIVPNYNHERYLEARIESILNQTYQDFEIILLDDKSTDGSVAIIEKYRDHPKVAHVVLNTQNSGSTFRQWERGLNLAIGEFSWIAESDDVAEPEFLERMMPLFDSRVELAFCNSSIIDENGGKISTGLENASWVSPRIDREDFSRSYVSKGIEEIRRHLIYSNTIYNASAVVVRTRLIRVVLEGLDEYRLYGDWLAWVRCCVLSEEVAYEATPLNNFRTHTGNVRSDMSSRYDLQLKESKKMRASIAMELRPPVPASERMIKINNEEGRLTRQQLLREAAQTLDLRSAIKLIRTNSPSDIWNLWIWKSILSKLVRRKA